MKTLIFICIMGFVFAACDPPKSTQTTTQDSVKVNNPDTLKIKKDTLP
jgi:hypothetical protein